MYQVDKQLYKLKSEEYIIDQLNLKITNTIWMFLILTIKAA